MARKDVSDLQVCFAYLFAKRIKELVDAQEEMTGLYNITKHIFVYDLLMHWTSQPFKVCYRAMERAHDRGLIDYGCTLRGGWVTQKGFDLIDKACADAEERRKRDCLRMGKNFNKG